MPFLKIKEKLLDKETLLLVPNRVLVQKIFTEQDDFAMDLPGCGVEQDFSSSASWLIKAKPICHDADRAPSGEEAGIAICLISKFDIAIETPEGTFYILDKSSIVLCF